MMDLGAIKRGQSFCHNHPLQCQHSQAIMAPPSTAYPCYCTEDRLTNGWQQGSWNSGPCDLPMFSCLLPVAWRREVRLTLDITG